MRKDLFKIETIKSEEYPFIVYSRDVNTMSDYVIEVAKKLQKKNHIGLVLFDLLLSNGVEDRYYSLKFDGLKFDFKSLKKVDISIDLCYTSNCYYKTNIKLLKSSILTNIQISKFIKEIRELSLHQNSLKKSDKLISK